MRDGATMISELRMLGDPLKSGGQPVPLIDLAGASQTVVVLPAIQEQELHQAGDRPPLLSGRVLGLVFEKPSLRTRVSFEAGMAQLGGRSIFLSASDGPIGRRESDSSPKIRESNGWPARRPDIMRIVEPEFPASRFPSGCFHPLRPYPWI